MPEDGELDPVDEGTGSEDEDEIMDEAETEEAAA